MPAPITMLLIAAAEAYDAEARAEVALNPLKRDELMQQVVSGGLGPLSRLRDTIDLTLD